MLQFRFYIYIRMSTIKPEYVVLNLNLTIPGFPHHIRIRLAATKEIVERRHGGPIKFLFLPKMGLLGSQASNEKNCWLRIMSNFLGLFFHV
jgi:hypothetical protein